MQKLSICDDDYDMQCIHDIVQIFTFENNSLSTDGDNSKRFFVVDVDPDEFLSVQ